MLVKEGGDYQPVLAMETKPSELGEMEDESLVAQVPCEPGGGDYSYTQRGTWWRRCLVNLG